MGLFGRSKAAGVTIRAEDLYEAVHHAMVKTVPSLAPTITPYGVMVLYLPTTALMLNLSGKSWSIGMLDTENFPQMTTRKTINTTFEATQTAELIVSVLERCANSYQSALDDPALTGTPEARQWFTERHTEVLAALMPNG